MSDREGYILASLIPLAALVYGGYELLAFDSADAMAALPYLAKSVYWLGVLFIAGVGAVVGTLILCLRHGSPSEADAPSRQSAPER